MQRRIRVAALLLAMASLGAIVAGCAQTTAVMPSSEIYRLTLLSPGAGGGMAWEDEAIRVEFKPATFSFNRSVNMPLGVPLGDLPGIRRVEFRLRNLSSNTLYLVWDRAVFVHVDGSASRVVHRGVRFIERDRPMPPSPLPANSALEEVVAPVDMVDFRGGEWVQDPFLTALDAGKSIAVILPVQSPDGSVREYRFEFGLGRL